jgi:hypothetical protein
VLVRQERVWLGLLKLDEEPPELPGAAERLLARVELPGQRARGRGALHRLIPVMVIAIGVGAAAGAAVRWATTPSAEQRLAAELHVSLDLQREVVSQLPALQALARDPWLADDYETVVWLRRVIQQEDPVP